MVLEELKVNIEKIKDALGLAGVLLALSLGVWNYVKFIVAFLSPSKTVTVWIDLFGEAVFEFYILWPIMLGLMVWGLIWFLHEALFEKSEELEEQGINVNGMLKERLMDHRYEDASEK